MNRDDAVAALRAQGIRNPSPQLVSDWLRMQQSEEWALELPDSAREAPTEPEQEPSSPESAGSENPTPPRPTSSKSNLKPLLRDRNELERPAGRRKAGRPVVQAPWFQAVATVMSDGTPLRQALSLCGVYGLNARQIRSLYRNRVFQALYKEARRKWLSEYGVRKRRTVRKGLRQLLRSL